MTRKERRQFWAVRPRYLRYSLRRSRQLRKAMKNAEPSKATEEILEAIREKCSIKLPQIGLNSDWVNRCWHVVGDKINTGPGVYMFENDSVNGQEPTIDLFYVDIVDGQPSNWNNIYRGRSAFQFIHHIQLAQIERQDGEW